MQVMSNDAGVKIGLPNRGEASPGKKKTSAETNFYASPNCLSREPAPFPGSGFCCALEGSQQRCKSFDCNQLQFIPCAKRPNYTFLWLNSKLSEPLSKTNLQGLAGRKYLPRLCMNSCGSHCNAIVIWSSASETWDAKILYYGISLVFLLPGLRL